MSHVTCPDHRRRGSVYVVVLGTSMLLAVIGVSAIRVSRLQLRTTTWSIDTRDAGTLALSAVEMALAQLNDQTIADDPTWRGSYVNGEKVADVPFGRGTLSWVLYDNDGDLSDNINDPLDLYGIGSVGDARRVYHVKLEPSGQGLDCLLSAMHGDAGLIVNKGADVVRGVGGPASANANITNAGTVEADLETTGTVTNSGTITGSTTEGVTAKQMPDPDAVFDYYINNGTRIDVNDLSVCSGSFRCIERAVLSPQSNPYGTQTNRQGIYVIDCQGQNVRILNSRIVGTIVLYDAGNDCRVSNAVSWEAAVPNYPVLMVQARVSDVLTINLDTTTLDEAALSTNFNPEGTPYNGFHDAINDDTYPSRINGLVYTSGGVNAVNLTMDGVLVSGGMLQTDVVLATTLTINHKFLYYRNPPPGFRAGASVAPVAGTWERAPLP